MKGFIFVVAGILLSRHLFKIGFRRKTDVVNEIQNQKELFLEQRVQARTEKLEEIHALRLINAAKFRTIFDQQFQLTGLLSADGILLEANQTALSFVGLPRGEVVGKQFWLTPFWTQSEEQHAQLKAAIKDAAAGNFVRFETEHFGVDGRMDVDFSLKPIVEADGTTVLIAEGRDITERKNAEKQLETLAQELARSNRDLQQFAHAASHDLQEPLRTVTGFCALLSKKLGSDIDSDSKKYLSVISEATVRMQQLIKALLLYASVGAQDIAFENLNLEEPYKTALAALQVSIDESGAEIVCDQLPMVHGDRTQLTLLFQNLIGNSIKFRSAAPPEIRISVNQFADRWELMFSDNGCGFKMEYADQIFVIFQKLHSRAKYEGTGIGLATCKRIIERHGGTIRAESELGKGAKFIVTFKAAES